MSRPGVTQAKHLLALERRARVFALRKLALSYRQIAAQMWADPVWAAQLHRHYGPRHAHADVMAELRSQRAALNEDVRLVRQLELARLDWLQTAIWGDAMRGNLHAIDAVLNIMTKRAVLLGLHAPIPRTRATATGASTVARTDVATGVSDVEIEATARALAVHGQRLLEGCDNHPYGKLR